MEATNKNVRFVLQLGDVDVFIFYKNDCVWDNHLMGKHNGIEEYCITIPNPVGRDIEVFAKEGEVVQIQTYVDFDGNIVAKVAVVLPYNVAKKVIYGYDELKEDTVSFEDAFKQDVEDEEPSMDDIRRIEEEEIEELLYKSQHLTLEDLLEDEDN